MKKQIQISVEGKKMDLFLYSVVDHYAIDFTLSGDDRVFGLDTMIGFKSPITALKLIGQSAMELAASVKKDIPVWFTGSDDRRHRVYGAMLKKAGINILEIFDENNDLPAWQIIID